MRLQWIVPILLGVCCLQHVGANTSSADSRASIRTELAAEYFRRAQFSIAIDEAKKAIDISSSYAPAYGMLGLIYMEIRDDTKAKEYFIEALDLAPNDSNIRHNYGYFLCDRGQYQAGLGEYQKVLRDPLYKNMEKTLSYAGQCAEKIGNLDDARGYYERALRLQPGSQQVKLLLSGLLIKTNRLPEARRYALELVRQPNPPAEMLWMVVRIERLLGNREGEQRYAETLRRQFPDSLETSKLLAGQYD